MSTGYVWLERYGWHDTGRYAGFIAPGGFVQPYEHFESAESKVRFASLIEVSGLGRDLVRLDVSPVTREQVEVVHDPAYVERIRRESEQPKGGEVENGSPFGNGGYDIALLAAGGTLAAVEAVLRGDVDNAYALVRPPGHHAEAARGMGFCIFSNIGVAVSAARVTTGVGRVAVVDWDVHHGNGTQDVFWTDADTLTISIHQDHLYPTHSGEHGERGSAEAFGANLNVPLPAGSGNGAYLEAMRRVVVPALERFRPDLIVVASGFDAGIHDPLGRMMVTADGYRQMTRILMDVAGRVADGRVVMSHEGGYSPVYVPVCGLAVLEEMSGVRTEVTDPFVSAALAGIPDQALQPHQRAAVESAVLLVDGVPGA